VHARGLTLHVIGRKEVTRYADLGLDWSRANWASLLIRKAYAPTHNPYRRRPLYPPEELC
jgi:hypothetical protein